MLQYLYGASFDRFPHLSNGEMHYTCEACNEFYTTSHTLLYEHIKYFHGDFPSNQNNVLNFSYPNSSHISDMNSISHEALDVKGQICLKSLQTENNPASAINVDRLEINVKQEWFDFHDHLEMEKELGNGVIIHRDVFECEVCDEVFVGKQKYINHLSGKLHVFNEISKNSVPSVNNSNCNSDDDDDGDVKFDVCNGIINKIENTCSEHNDRIFYANIKREHLDPDDCPKYKMTRESGINLNIKYDMNEAEDLKCKLCNYQAVNIKGIRAHVFRKHLQNTVTYSCKKCPFETQFKVTLGDHYKTCHKGISFTCDECHLCFNTFRRFDSHIRAHEYTEQCELCNEKVIGKNQIYFHYYHEHEGYDFNCKQCSFTTKTPKKFIEHKEAGHFTWNCEHCDFSASKKSVLLSHLKQHVTRVTRTQHMTPEETNEIPIEPDLSPDLQKEELVRETRSMKMYDNYKCNICDCFFKTHSILEDHMKALHSFPCDKCDYVGGNLSMLTSHQNSHNSQTKVPPILSKNKRQCEYCSQLFRRASAVEKHIALKHTGDKPYSCYLCEEKFENSESLRTHMNSLHALLFPYSCNICFRRNSKYTHLSRHKLLVHQKQIDGVGSVEIGEKYSCTQCSYQTYHKHALDNHMPLHSLDRKHQCPVCLRRFSRQSDNNTHQRRVHGVLKPTPLEMQVEKRDQVALRMKPSAFEMQSESQLTCDICDRVFQTDKQWKLHMGFHNTKRRLPCKLCGFRLKNHKQLKLHQRYHLSSNLFRCEKCNLGYSRKDSFEYHMTSHNQKEQTFMCTQCDFTSSSKDTLNTHAMVHADELKYSCQNCDFKCENKALYLKHLTDHKKQNSLKIKQKQETVAWYKCPSCHLRFLNFRLLKSHARRVHSQSVNSFICACGQEFSRPRYLSIHVRHKHRKNNNNVLTSVESSNILPVIMLSPLKSANSKETANTPEVFELPFKCVVCKKSFLKVSFLRKHMENIHNSHTYKCWDCGFICTKSLELISHLPSHSSYLKCNKCGHVFSHYKNKIAHIENGCNTNFKNIQRCGPHYSNLK